MQMALIGQCRAAMATGGAIGHGSGEAEANLHYRFDVSSTDWGAAQGKSCAHFRIRQWNSTIQMDGKDGGRVVDRTPVDRPC